MTGGESETGPKVGLVIRHAYLWWNEARKGREEGLPAAMTRDLIAQVKANAQDKSLRVIGRTE